MAHKKGKVVVITGASAGVGRATARAFAKEGAHIGLLARGQTGLEGAKKDVEEAGGRALTVTVDVSNAEAVEQAARQVEETFGPIDVWVNNAMVTVFSPIKDMTAEEFRRVTEVTYLGYVNGTLSALKRMLPRNKGTIVQVGSALAKRSIPLQSAYCAAKHAVDGFTESLRIELMHDKSRVKVTVVHMPALNTPQFDWVKSHLAHKPQPVPPIFQPEVAADAIVYASKHPRREYWVAFSTAKAILAEKWVPGLADRYLAKKGYSGQKTNQLESPDRPNNLLEPADKDKDFGAHGSFDERSEDSNWQIWFSRHRALASVAGVAGVAAIVAAIVRYQVQ